MSDSKIGIENLFDACGCGKPSRYSDANGEGACNKYRRCPTYDELRKSFEAIRVEYHQLIEMLARFGDAIETAQKERSQWRPICGENLTENIIADLSLATDNNDDGRLVKPEQPK